MIVIADTSPLIVLVNIDHIDVLPALFHRILITPAIFSELTNAARPIAVRSCFSTPPAWLTTQRPIHNRPIAKLHPGETEALNLALELSADFLLIDERLAYREAIARKINAIGTVRVLERAAEENLIDLATAFERLKKTDFWIPHTLLDERLHLHLLQKPKGNSP